MTQAAIRIFEIMDERHIDEATLCRQYGFKHSTVNEWKNACKDPSPNQIKKFCRAMHITLACFYTGSVFHAGCDDSDDVKADSEFEWYVKRIRKEHKEKEAIPFLRYVEKAQ